MFGAAVGVTSASYVLLMVVLRLMSRSLLFAWLWLSGGPVVELEFWRFGFQWLQF